MQDSFSSAIFLQKSFSVHRYNVDLSDSTKHIVKPSYEFLTNPMMYYDVMKKISLGRDTRMSVRLF
jgi:hypothetical protein